MNKRYYQKEMRVQVVGVRENKITRDGSGTQIFETLTGAKEVFPGIDLEKNTKEFTWAVLGTYNGKVCVRFETWEAYNRLSQ